MDKLSKNNQAILVAVERGYTIDDSGIVYNRFGRKVKGYLRNGYMTFTVKMPKSRHNIGVKFHRLQAYKNFGELIFKKDIVCRHLDGNPLNNTKDNILIGTPRQNMMDQSKEVRMRKSLNAAKHLRRFSDSKMKEVLSFYEKCKSYKKTMEEFDISSKGTLNYMINNKYPTALT